MKIVVLGGAGEMGRRAVRALATFPEVDQITVADLDLARAEALADDLGGRPRLRAVQVDAMDEDSLRAVLSGSDVAASAVGPFYLFERRVAAAAIAAGVDLVTLCDDHDATLAVLELDGEARRAGRRIVTGLGWTPGLSNMLALRGAALLDRAREVHIAWAGSNADSKGHAVMLHTLHIFSGHVPSFRNGAMTTVRAGSGGGLVTFPPPIGDVRCFHVGHPEPITLPRHLPGLEAVTLRGGLSEPFLTALARAVTWVGLADTPRKRSVLGRVIERALPVLERIGPPSVACSGLRVDVIGERGGRPAKVSFQAADRMENLTGIPLAIGAVLLGRGAIVAMGVMAPEAPGAVPPDLLLEELARHGVHVDERGDGADAAATRPPRTGQRGTHPA
jgi:lysine 6-dehydrogenase